MRFLSFREGDKSGVAVETAPGRFHGRASDDHGFPGTFASVASGGPDAFKRAADALASGTPIDPQTAHFDLPVSRPGRVICIGLNYRAHAEETGHAIPEYPTLFARFAASLIPHGTALVRPKVSTLLDYEGELVIVVGKPGRHIPKGEALDHVAGYSVFNDGSIRDYQMRTPQWTIGKNFDGTGAFGPYFVTADALHPGAADLRLTTRVNGETVQDTSTSDMIFDTATLVSLMSEAFTLHPGDLIATGTPSGVGGLRKPQLFLKPGDVCEVEIEGIGTLSNTVVDEA